MTKSGYREHRLNPAWWTVILLVIICTAAVITIGRFSGAFTGYVPVTLVSQRSGLVLEDGGKVKFRGVEVGRIRAVGGQDSTVSIDLELYPATIGAIPANVEPRIRASTAFGAKFVDLVYPQRPSPQRLAKGAVLQASNVSTEVNTVFENLTVVLRAVEPAKLNAILSALSEALRGRGERIGGATVGADQLLADLNPRTDQLIADMRAFGAVSDLYGNSAGAILDALTAFTVTSTTITSQQDQLQATLMAAIGVADSGVELLGPIQGTFVDAINTAAPTTSLLMKYNPEYTCLLQGTDWILNEAGGYNIAGGGNGKSVILDAAITYGDDMYRFPDHLPIVAAKGGPGGRPGCGSLPRADLQFPVRQLVTNTGWGAGRDEIRTNPGIGSPWGVNYFPVTKGVPEPPRYYGDR